MPRLCDRCHEREATMHVVMVVGEKKIDRWLCPACAAEVAPKAMLGQAPDSADGVKRLLEDVLKPMLGEDEVDELLAGLDRPRKRKLLRIPPGVYTRAAAVVLTEAREWARNHRHRSLRPAHLLWALLERENCYGADLLRRKGAKLDELRQQVRTLIAYAGDGDEEPELSTGVTEVLEAAGKAAHEDNLARVDTGHLLVGLLDYLEHHANTALFNKVKPATDDVPALSVEPVAEPATSVRGEGGEMASAPAEGVDGKAISALTEMEAGAGVASAQADGDVDSGMGVLTADLPALFFPDVTAQKIARQIRADFIENHQLPEGNLFLDQQARQERQERLQEALKALEPFGENLCELYKEGKLDPVIGRRKEIDHLAQVLCRRTKNNPVLIGAAGVGKTAVAEGLAERIVDGQVPQQLRDKVVFSVDLGSVLSGAKYKGEMEERMQAIIGAASEAPELILFMDELHVLASGGGDGTPSLGSILKPYLTRGAVRIVGATTTEEYRRHIEKDAALERRFQPILVEAPTTDETLAILQGLRPQYSDYHHITITDEALRAAVRLADRYITDRQLPDKAIDLLDEACSYLKLHPDMDVLPEATGSETRAEVLAETRGMGAGKAVRTSTGAAAGAAGAEGRLLLTPTVVQHVIAAWTGIPLEHLSAAESKNLLALESRLHERLIGQETAVKAVARAVRRARAGLKDRNRPVGSFLFLGPTGVGKTELAKTLAECLFGDERAMIRFDMSEFSERHTVARFMGAPPSYVGYEDGGELTKQVQRRPYSVILLDEIEKAHPDVFNILLQIMEDGRLTDGHGRTVDFKNCVLIMTSNAGVETLEGPRALGFGAAERPAGVPDKKELLENIKKVFRPEFLNRLDDVLVFDALGAPELAQIVDLLVRDLQKRLDDMGLKLTVTPAAKTRLVREGTDARYGARPLRRALRRWVEDRLADLYLEGVFTDGDTVLVDVLENEFVFTRVEQVVPARERETVMLKASRSAGKGLPDGAGE